MAQTLSLWKEDAGVTNGLNDASFADNKDIPVHRWVPWIAGFSANFVDNIIDSFAKRKGSNKLRVLDPFAGVGTTLFQTIIKGYDAIGFEINPYPAMVAEAKIRSLKADINILNSTIREIANLSEIWRKAPPPKGVKPPPLKTKIEFLSPAVESQALHAKKYIEGVQDADTKALLKTAFAAILVSVSNYTYEPSLGTRPSAGKPLVEDADFGYAILEKITQIRDDIVHLRSTTLPNKTGSGEVINGNFFESNGYLDDHSVDLLITSPPYLNNYHYIRNTRPHLYWLSFIEKPTDQKIYEEGNFGKYWQNVRGKKCIYLDFKNNRLENIIAALRKKRSDKKTYGGKGWANYVVTYFNDVKKYLDISKRVVKPGGSIVTVIGNSYIQGLEIKVDEILAEIATGNGYLLVDNLLLRNKRVGTSILGSTVRNDNNNGGKLYETAVILKRE